MAATIQIHEMSALETGVVRTAIRYKDADNATVDGVNVLVVPSAGSIYSYTKKLRLYLLVAPAVQIGNVRWFSDGANGYGTGVSVTVKNLGVTWGANYKTQMSGGADWFGYTSAAPLDGDSVDTGPFLPASVGGYIGDLLEFQMAIASTATGNRELPDEGYTCAVDEV